MTLLDLSENSGCRIGTDKTDSNCHTKCRMQLRVYVVYRCRRKSLLRNKRIIELLYIGVLYLYQPSLTKCLPDEVIIGVNVIHPGRRFQVVFLFDVRIKYIVDCNTLCSLGIQSILQIASDLLLLLPQFDQILAIDSVPLTIVIRIRV